MLSVVEGGTLQLPSHLHNLPAYVPGESVESLAARLGRSPESIIKLDSNENNYGTAPAVQRALAALTGTNRYPDPSQSDLRAALSAYTGVPSDYLLAGNGSDELLSLLAQVLLQPGERILVCPPTFSQYAFYARLKNCEVINVPREADFSLDIEGIISAVQARSPKILYIDSPGNPTGNSIPINNIGKILALPVLIVLDEAYSEFTQSRSLISEVPDRQNLVVLRTFSKWAGLAGFRVGYGAFPKWLANALWQAKSPFNVTMPAMAAAIAALSEEAFLKNNISRVIADRDRLAAGLRKFNGLSVYPSDANFLLVECREPQRFLQAGKDAGLIVRDFSAAPALTGCLRISIGTPDQNERLLTAVECL